MWAQDTNISTVSTKFSATGDVTTNFTQTGTFTKAKWNLDVTWKTTDQTYWGNLETKGSQIGSGSKPASKIVLTGKDIPGTIKSVKVNTAMASGGAITVEVAVGGIAFKCNQASTATLATSSADYDFIGSSSGDVVITWNQASTSKAIYIKSVTVTYIEDTSAPLATLSTSNLDFGSVSYGSTKEMTFTVTPANLTGDLSISCDNNKYTVNPTTIASTATTAQTITVTAAPTALDDEDRKSVV